MKLKKYKGEPCGSGNFPEEVLLAVEIMVPMSIALTLDKKTLLLMDDVDYFITQEMDKAEAENLALKFKQLAESMVC